MGVRELARLAKQTPSSTHGLLQDLVADGFVEFDESRRQYRLGLAVLTLADGMDAAESLGSFARPWVNRLVDELGETTMALTWRGGRAVVVAAVEARHDLRVGSSHRIVEKPHLWASGQVVVAWLPAEDRRDYIAQQGLDEADSTALEATLATVQRQGWASAINLADSGVAAFGAPILDSNWRCILAVGTSAPLSRADTARQRLMRERLLAMTADMTASLSAPITTMEDP